MNTPSPNTAWRRLSLPLLSLALLAACASPAMAPQGARMEGGMWVGHNGMTLYTFDRDVTGSGKSACNGPCATNWLPLTASTEDRGSGDWSVITRDDGKRQWAHKGKPLYFWTKDQKPGDANGDGFNQVWHIAR